MTVDQEALVTLTADIVAAHVSNNSVSVNDMSNLIGAVHTALAGLGAAPVAAEPEKPKGAVSVRASIKQDHLISMIDGKPYKMLKRHISQNGYTPESYRETFGLPKDYPLVAPSYAETRRALAHKIGLGRKKAEVAPPPATSGRKPRAKKSDAPTPAER